MKFDVAIEDSPMAFKHLTHLPDLKVKVFARPWNEVVSAKAAKLMKEIYPQTVVKCFKGYAHAELAIYHSDEWIKTVDEFIS